VAAPLEVACSLGSLSELAGLLTGAGLEGLSLEEVTLDLPLGALETFVPHHLASTPMAGVVRGAGDEAMAELVGQVVHRLDAMHSHDVTIPFTQLVALASAPPRSDPTPPSP
jgi:hypothetical protein